MGWQVPRGGGSRGLRVGGAGGRRAGSRFLRRGGTSGCGALLAENVVKLPIFETVITGLTIHGSIVGTREDLGEVYALHALGRTHVIRESRKLADVNECFEQVEKGDIKARIVFDMR